MPGRKVPLVTGQIYHVFNRGIARMPTFSDRRTYRRAINLMNFYQNIKVPLKYSHFMTLARERREEMLKSIRYKKEFLIDIIGYCLMPNHFHFLLHQKVDNGISKFMADFTNSYTKFFNIRENRLGALFQGRFKAVLIETTEQLLHVIRYIHLNPYTSHIVKSPEDLLAYEFSSYPDYLDKRKSDLVSREIVMSYFADTKAYEEFVLSQADYQRSLHEIQHLILE